MKDKKKCSQCEAQVKEDNEQYKNYVETLEFLFPTLSGHDEIDAAGQSISPTAEDSISHIVITTLSGECTTIIYDPDQTIVELKDKVEQELKTPSNKQSLLYNDIEMKVCISISLSRYYVYYHGQKSRTSLIFYSTIICISL